MSMITDNDSIKLSIGALGKITPTLIPYNSLGISGSCDLMHDVALKTLIKAAYDVLISRSFSIHWSTGVIYSLSDVNFKTVTHGYQCPPYHISQEKLIDFFTFNRGKEDVDLFLSQNYDLVSVLNKSFVCLNEIFHDIIDYIDLHLDVFKEKLICEVVTSESNSEILISKLDQFREHYWFNQPDTVRERMGVTVA